MKRIVIVTIVGLAAVLLMAATPALAAPGGKGGRTAAQLAVYQNDVQVSAVAAGSADEVRGSGLGSDRTVYVGLQGYFGMTPVTTDSSGSFRLAQTAPVLAGTYTYIVMVYRHSAWEIAASATFAVE